MQKHIIITNFLIKTNQFGVYVIDDCLSWLQMEKQCATAKKRFDVPP